MKITYGLVAVLFAHAAACGDEFVEDEHCAQVTCNEDPWCCPSGQTCAPDTQSSFACLNVGTGQQGDTCQNFVGTPHCGELLFCFQPAGASAGQCTPFCDATNPDRACPNLHHCLANVTVGSAGNVSLCDPNPPPS